MADHRIIVSRHQALVEFLREQGLAEAEDVVLSHVGEEDVRGKDVVGVLPLHLAAVARTVTEVPLQLPPELRGKELSLEEVRQYAGAPRTFVVREIPTNWEIPERVEIAFVPDNNHGCPGEGVVVRPLSPKEGIVLQTWGCSHCGNYPRLQEGDMVRLPRGNWATASRWRDSHLDLSAAGSTAVQPWELKRV